jgi:sialate O-acetylesterase
VAYFFAQKLYEQHKVPIGILHSSWPGTPAESWISMDSLAAYPAYIKVATEFSRPGFTDSLVNAEKTQAAGWRKQVRNNDAGLAGQWAKQPAGLPAAPFRTDSWEK